MDSRETHLANLKSAIEVAGTKDEKFKALSAYAEFQKSFLIEHHRIRERLKKESSTAILKNLISQSLSEKMAHDLIELARTQNVKRLLQSNPTEEEISKILGNSRKIEGLWTIGIGIVAILLAVGMSFIFTSSSEEFSRSSGSDHYSMFLPTGAILTGVICILRGIYRLLAD